MTLQINKLLIKRRGFSLIELLVVIAVISVLLAILFPSLRLAVAIVRQTVCTSNLRQISIMTQMYTYDYDQYIIPSARNSDRELRYPGNEDPYLGGPPWYELLRQSYGLDCSSENAFILHCPSDRRDKGYCSYSGNRNVMGFSEPNEEEEFNYPLRRITSVKTRLDNIIMLGERGCVEEGDIGKVDGQWSMSGIAVERFLGTNGNHSVFGNIGFLLDRHSTPRAAKGESDSNSVSNIKLPFALLDGHVQVYKGQIEGGNFGDSGIQSFFLEDSPGGDWPRMTVNRSVQD